jgi:HIRAN domain
MSIPPKEEHDPAPLLAGPIHGIRTWQVLRDGATGGGLLVAISGGVVWPRGEPMHAFCDSEARFPVPRHPAPDPDCMCGIYGLHPTPKAAEQVLTDWHVLPAQPSVSGVIAAWGRVELHGSGFRAEWARPVTLIIDPHAQRDRGRLATIREMAAGYGADLIRVNRPEDLIEHCRRRELGLGARAVKDLLLSQVPITLRPDERVFVRRDGRRFIGSGYAPEGQEGPWSLYHSYDEVAAEGAHLLRVAGATRSRVLARAAFEPGERVTLVPEPENPHDPYAVGVWDAEERWRVGYLPQQYAPALRDQASNGLFDQVMSVWQWRDEKTGRRVGLHVLLAPTSKIRIIDGAGSVRNDDEGATDPE